MSDVTENKLATKGESHLFPPAASAYLLERHGIRHTVPTLASKRTKGDDPEFQKAGPAVLYTPAGLDRYAEAYLSAPVTSTSQLPPDRRRRA
jgi:hypothetical protein